MQISGLRRSRSHHPIGPIVLELLKAKNVYENAPEECELGKMRSKGKAWWGEGGRNTR